MYPWPTGGVKPLQCGWDDNYWWIKAVQPVSSTSRCPVGRPGWYGVLHVVDWIHVLIDRWMGHVVIKSPFHTEKCSLSSGQPWSCASSQCLEEDRFPRSFLLYVGGEAFEELGIFSLGHGSEDWCRSPTSWVYIGNVGNLTEDVVSADLFVALWWTNESLADHGNIDFGTNTPVCRKGIIVVHREVADQPCVGIILVCCQDLPDGWQIEHVSLRGRPHSLVRLINNDSIVGECFHNVEIFNGGWGRESSVRSWY